MEDLNASWHHDLYDIDHGELWKVFLQGEG